jgi:putative intracellular protease/amidase
MLASKLTGPMEFLEFAGLKSPGGSFARSIPGLGKPKVLFDIEYLAETRDPIIPMGGPPILPTKTLNEVVSKQFSIILIPGGKPVICFPPQMSESEQPAVNIGPTARPDMASKAVTEFIQQQAAHAQYILTVCTGSWLLAGAGLLEGKRATTNKFTFNEVKVDYSAALDILFTSFMPPQI